MRIIAKFDGRVFVPEEPVNLAQNQRVIIRLELLPPYSDAAQKVPGSIATGENQFIGPVASAEQTDAAEVAESEQSVSIRERFRAAREQAGLSISDFARLANISDSSVWDIEGCADELMSVYCAAELRQFAKILGASCAHLLGFESRNDALTLQFLSSAIRQSCLNRKIDLPAFEDAAGWYVAENLDDPEQFLTGPTIAGLQDICREAGVDWERIISGF